MVQEELLRHLVALQAFRVPILALARSRRGGFAARLKPSKTPSMSLEVLGEVQVVCIRFLRVLDSTSTRKVGRFLEVLKVRALGDLSVGFRSFAV